MSTRLPIRFDPYSYADQERQITALTPLNRMTRLAESSLPQVGNADVHLHFKRDERRRVVVTGRICAEVTLTCQRCMQPMQERLEIDVAVALIQSEAQAEKLPDEWDPWLIQDDHEAMARLVEDELILSLPLVPMHPESMCVVETIDHTQAEPEDDSSRAPQAVDTEQAENPFAMLAALKQDLKKS